MDETNLSVQCGQGFILVNSSMNYRDRQLNVCHIMHCNCPEHFLCFEYEF